MAPPFSAIFETELFLDSLLGWGRKLYVSTLALALAPESHTAITIPLWVKIGDTAQSVRCLKFNARYFIYFNINQKTIMLKHKAAQYCTVFKTLSYYKSFIQRQLIQRTITWFKSATHTAWRRIIFGNIFRFVKTFFGL